MAPDYDVIIVGGGPAGIFAALELTQAAGLSVLLIEKGRDITRRKCPVRGTSTPCMECSPCNVTCGLGGAGAFSDGKLVLTSQIGGLLAEYTGREATETLIKYVDELYLKFGAAKELFGAGDVFEAASRRAARAGLHLVPAVVRHMGTDSSYAVLKAMQDYLETRLEFRFGEMAAGIIVEDGEAKGIVTDGGQEISCRYLVLAPGREGSDWFLKEAERLKLTMRNNPIDVGVRVEVPAAIMADLTDVLYEVKLEYTSPSFGDRIRTFCMCPSGEVITESTGGGDPVVTVNGHSYADRKTQNTNFALLVSTDFTRPFNEPIAYGKNLARLANMLGGGVLVQRLGDLTGGHRSTPARLARGRVRPTLKSAAPGDLSFALPYRHLTGLLEMLQALDRMIPGVASPDTLLYGLEVKFYSVRPQLTGNLETEVRNMFAVGDGTGVSRGLVQASASGLVASCEILRRLGSACRAPS